MEPTNLTPSSGDAAGDAHLETFLRQPLAPLADDGFSARVLTALPPSYAARASTRRKLLVAGGALVGLVIAYPQVNPLAPLVSRIYEFDHTVLVSYGNPSFWMATSAVLLAGLLALFGPELESA